MKRSQTTGSRAVVWATVVAGVMIAQQVGAKSVRDALFLSQLGAPLLPRMMVAAALASLPAVLLAGRLLESRGPALIVPLAFALDSVLFLGEWALLPRWPAAVAIGIYLHVALLGAIVISGFWSLVNERFDPHRAKHVVARIAAGATLGGSVGGLLANRIADAFGTVPLLLVLAGATTSCAVGTWRLGQGARKRASHQRGSARSALRALRGSAYLRGLGAMVTTVACGAALADYVLKAQAAESFATGRALASFFTLYYTAVSVATFLVQSLISPHVLRRFGLGAALATMPAAMMAAGALAGSLAKLWTATLLRGTQATLANSIYRSGYELLFTPIPRHEKRSAKTLIDVALDRGGDAAGSALIIGLLAVFAEQTARPLAIWLAVAFAALAFWMARRLEGRYVAQLEHNLEVSAEPPSRDDVLQASAFHTLSESIGALDRRALLREIEHWRGRHEASVMGGARGAAEGRPVSRDPSLATYEALGSDDAERVGQALRRRPVDPRVVPIVIERLGVDAHAADASHALESLGQRVLGQLVDALLDRERSFVVRKRIPRLLARLYDERSVVGLMRGLRDERFELRYRCAHALQHVVEHRPELQPDASTVMEVVHREVGVSRQVWDARDQPDRRTALEERPRPDTFRRRGNRSLDHVFTLLGLVYGRRAMHAALSGLESEDDRLRGTALEYLENVLPSRIRAPLWAHLGNRRSDAGAPRRSASEALDDLMQSVEKAKPGPREDPTA